MRTEIDIFDNLFEYFILQNKKTKIFFIITTDDRHQIYFKLSSIIQDLKKNKFFTLRLGLVNPDRNVEQIEVRQFINKIITNEDFNIIFRSTDIDLIYNPDELEMQMKLTSPEYYI